MKWTLGIPFAVALAVITITISQVVGFNLVAVMVVVTGFWASVDSKNIELRKYKSGIAYHPTIIFILFFLFWIVAFPWYLHLRYKVQNGLEKLKEDDSEMAA